MMAGFFTLVESIAAARLRSAKHSCSGVMDRTPDIGFSFTVVDPGWGWLLFIDLQISSAHFSVYARAATPPIAETISQGWVVEGVSHPFESV